MTSSSTNASSRITRCCIRKSAPATSSRSNDPRASKPATTSSNKNSKTSSVDTAVSFQRAITPSVERDWRTATTPKDDRRLDVTNPLFGPHGGMPCFGETLVAVVCIGAILLAALFL